MEVFIMATTTLILIVALLAVVIFPLIGNLNHTELRHTDLMAGDEGED
jgi:hypothetical protein